MNYQLHCYSPVTDDVDTKNGYLSKQEVTAALEQNIRFHREQALAMGYEEANTVVYENDGATEVWTDGELQARYWIDKVKDIQKTDMFIAIMKEIDQYGFFTEDRTLIKNNGKKWTVSSVFGDSVLEYNFTDPFDAIDKFQELVIGL